MTPLRGPQLGSPAPLDPDSPYLPPLTVSCTGGGGGPGGLALGGDAARSSHVSSPVGALGVVWGAFIQLHGLAGP